MRKKIRKISAGVHFEKRVLEYLDHLAEDEALPRSVLLNRIVKEYAKNKGQKIISSIQ